MVARIFRSPLKSAPPSIRIGIAFLHLTCSPYPLSRILNLSDISPVHPCNCHQICPCTNHWPSIFLLKILKIENLEHRPLTPSIFKDIGHSRPLNRHHVTSSTTHPLKSPPYCPISLFHYSSVQLESGFGCPALCFTWCIWDLLSHTRCCCSIYMWRRNFMLSS